MGGQWLGKVSAALLLCLAFVSASSCDNNVTTCGRCLQQNTCGWCEVQEEHGDVAGYCTGGDMIGAFDGCKKQVGHETTTATGYYYGSCDSTLEENKNIAASVAVAGLLGGVFICAFGYRYIVPMLCVVGFFSTYLLVFLVMAKLMFYADVPFSFLLARLPPFALAVVSALITFASYKGKLPAILFKVAVFELGLIAGVFLMGTTLCFRVGSFSLFGTVASVTGHSFATLLITWGLCGVCGSVVGLLCTKGRRAWFIFSTAFVGAVIAVMCTIALCGYLLGGGIRGSNGGAGRAFAISLQRVLLTHSDTSLSGDSGSGSGDYSHPDDWDFLSYVMFAAMWGGCLFGMFMQGKVTAKKGLRHLTCREARRAALQQEVDDYDLRHLRRIDPVTGTMIEMSLGDTEDGFPGIDPMDSSDDDISEVIQSARRRVAEEGGMTGTQRALSAVGLHFRDADHDPYGELLSENARRGSGGSPGGRRQSREARSSKKEKKRQRRRMTEASDSESSQSSSASSLRGQPVPQLSPVSNLAFPLLTKVEVGYEEAEQVGWYAAMVTGYSVEDKAYTVRYDTGEVSYGVKEEFIRLAPAGADAEAAAAGSPVA